MLYRLFGKFVFLFFVMPFVAKHSKRMVLAMAEEFLDEQYQAMSDEQKRRFRKAYPALVKNEPVDKHAPHYFQSSPRGILCSICTWSETHPIHNA